MSNIVNAKCAKNAAQKVNRQAWLNSSFTKLSEEITAVANTGLCQLDLDLNALVQGAENLFEIGEMLQFIQAELDAQGYDVTVNRSASRVVIKW